MKSALVCFGAIGLGFALLIASALWTSVFPGTASWTPEKEARWSEVQHRLYDLSFLIHSNSRIHSGPDPATLKAEYDELKKEDELLQAEFESIADRPHTLSRILKWTGISLAVLGIIGWYAVKQTA